MRSNPPTHFVTRPECFFHSFQVRREPSRSENVSCISFKSWNAAIPQRWSSFFSFSQNVHTQIHHAASALLAGSSDESSIIFSLSPRPLERPIRSVRPSRKKKTSGDVSVCRTEATEISLSAISKRNRPSLRMRYSLHHYLDPSRSCLF